MIVLTIFCLLIALAAPSVAPDSDDFMVLALFALCDIELFKLIFKK